MSDWKALIRERLAGLQLSPARESEIIDELAQHLEDRCDSLVATGMDAQQAHRQTVDELNSKLLAEELNKLPRTPVPEPLGAFGGGYFSGLLHDLRIGARNIRWKPGFSFLVIGMLALGIAGNAAIFSIFNGLFLRPFPFPDAERLIDVDETAPKWNLQYVGVSDPDYHFWQRNASTFDGLAFFNTRGLNLTGENGSQRILGAAVTYNLLDVVGLKAALGRNFLPAEDRPGGPKVVLLSNGLWRTLYHADAHIPGHIVKLDDEPYTVIGVLPKEAVLPSDVDVWMPLQTDEANHGWYLQGVGRMKRGVALEQASADLLRVHKSMIKNGSRVNEITAPILTPLRERYLGDFRVVSQILLGAVAVVLLIACVNVAALMLVRGSARAREIAIRTAMGASRARIIRQLLSESLLLAGAGSIAGIGLGAAALRAMISFMPPQTLPQWVSFNLDARFAAFCMLITSASAALFGLAPAIQASRVDTRGALQDAGLRTTHSRGRRTTLRSLVVVEIALALVLLIAAGLVLQAFRKVLHVDPGFRPENVMTFSISLPSTKYPRPEQRLEFYQNLLAGLRPLPGVKAAGAVNTPPFGGHNGTFFEAEGDRPLGPNEKTPVVLQVTATPGYFEAIGMTLLAGRTFDERDGASKDAPSVIVNESFAKAHWPNQSAVGKRIRYSGSKSTWMQVIGVLRDEKHYGLDQDARPGVFIPYRLNPGEGMAIVMRGGVDPQTLVAPAREVLRQLDGELPMYQIRTMTQRVEQSLWARRAYSWLFAAFAGIALVLAAAGIYGVVAYAVSQRTQEIGIRMALGARPGQVLQQTLASGMLLVSIGAAIGLAGAFAAMRLLGSLLFGVSTHDPLIYGAVVLGVAMVGLLANFVPARRAAGIDPMRALRSE